MIKYPVKYDCKITWRDEKCCNDECNQNYEFDAPEAILNSSSWVPRITNTNHQNHKEPIETDHSKAYAVNCLKTNQFVTINDTIWQTGINTKWVLFMISKISIYGIYQNHYQSTNEINPEYHLEYLFQSHLSNCFLLVHLLTLFYVFYSSNERRL